MKSESSVLVLLEQSVSLPDPHSFASDVPTWRGLAYVHSNGESAFPARSRLIIGLALAVHNPICVIAMTFSGPFKSSFDLPLDREK